MAHSVGDLVEAFTLPRAGGGELTLDPGASPATVVLWTCNHCPYALAWHDRIQQVARDYADRGVAVLQLNANDAVKFPADSFAAMEQRVAAGEFASPYLHDESQEFARLWGAAVTPDVFVLDRDGRVVYHGAPDGDHDDEARAAEWLRAALDDVLAGRPVALPDTAPRGCSIKWRADA